MRGWARRRWSAHAAAGSALGPAALGLVLVTGCVTTTAEFRKLEDRVIEMERHQPDSSATQSRLADMGSRLEAIQTELERLQGRLEVVQREAELARKEARQARREAVSEKQAQPPAGQSSLDTGSDGAAADGGGASAAASAGIAAGSGAVAEDAEQQPGATAAEIKAYREARAAWRSGETQACIDRFRKFLQSYASSPYADDAAYWMADCHYREREYKTSILRFDDVVARYPTGNKAADALYRQGEALLRLGPDYSKAAGKAFERVLKEYPGSARTPEAKKQLELLGSG